MGESVFAALSRRTSGLISRRGSLLAMGTALAAVASLDAAGTSGKSKGKSRKKAKQQSFKLCKRQVEECQDFLAANCDAGNICIEVSAFCCPLLGKCQNAAFLTCLVERSNPEPEATGA